MLSIWLEAKGSGLGTEIVGKLFTGSRTELHGAITANGALPAFKIQIIPLHVTELCVQGSFPHPDRRTSTLSPVLD